MKLYKIKKSKIDNKGRGLYATRDIKEGTKIINYKGKILTNKQVDDYSFDFALDLLKQIGEKSRSYKQRLTFHPGQYTPSNLN